MLMNAHFRLLLVLSALCLASAAYAGEGKSSEGKFSEGKSSEEKSSKEKDTDAPFELAYSYGHAIDLQGGMATSAILVGGDSRKAFASFAGSCGQLRYSCFLSSHWGFYVSLASQAIFSGTTSFLRARNYADGGLYRYSSDYNVMSAALSYAMAGSVYRYDFGMCSVRARLGIGVGSYALSTGGFARYSRAVPSAYPEYISYSVETKKEDFLIDSGSNAIYYSDNTAFVAALSCQFCYTFRRCFYISAEIGINAACAPGVVLKQRTYQAESAYNPENWADAVIDYENRDAYKFTTYKEASARMPWAFFNASVGIGWNIGFNRRK